MPYFRDPRPWFDARKVIHVSLAAILLWLGFILILPGETFTTSQAWRLFASMGSETSWAIAFFAGGLVGALGIDTQHPWLQTASILILATYHGALGILFGIGNKFGGASGVFIIIALQGYYLCWRQQRQRLAEWS